MNREELYSFTGNHLRYSLLTVSPLINTFLKLQGVALTEGKRLSEKDTSYTEILYGNVAFSILALSTQKWSSSFLKKVFFFQKICFKDKVLIMFKIPSNCDKKTMPISQREGYFENP